MPMSSSNVYLGLVFELACLQMLIGAASDVLCALLHPVSLQVVPLVTYPSAEPNVLISIPLHFVSLTGMVN